MVWGVRWCFSFVMNCLSNRFVGLFSVSWQEYCGILWFKFKFFVIL